MGKHRTNAEGRGRIRAPYLGKIVREPAGGPLLNQARKRFFARGGGLSPRIIYNQLSARGGALLGGNLHTSSQKKIFKGAAESLPATHDTIFLPYGGPGGPWVFRTNPGGHQHKCKSFRVWGRLGMVYAHPQRIRSPPTKLRSSLRPSCRDLGPFNFFLRQSFLKGAGTQGDFFGLQ